MRSRIGLVVVGLLLAGAPGLRAQGGPAGFGPEFLGQFNTSMQKVIALAEAMPAEKYTWSPGEGVMTVARVYAHVARYNYMYPATSLGVAAPDRRDGDAIEDLTDKARILALLRESRDHVRNVVQGLPADLEGKTMLYGGQVTKRAVLLQLLAHMNEHLGQSIAYARMNGLVPPWSR
jgi:uncharacterized damage-inducible protein DinB